MLHVTKHGLIVLLLVAQALVGAMPAAGSCAARGDVAADEPSCCCAAAIAAEASCCRQPAQVRVCACSQERDRPIDPQQNRADELRLALRCAASESSCPSAVVMDDFHLLAVGVPSSLSSREPRLQALLCRWLT